MDAEKKDQPDYEDQHRFVLVLRIRQAPVIKQLATGRLLGKRV